MHPINYKSSDINSSLQIYFQILWVTNQFSDVNIFYEMPIGSLNIRLDSENHCIRKGNGDPLRYIFYFYLRAHVYSNKKDKLNKIFLINVFFSTYWFAQKILSFDSIPLNKANIYSLTWWSLHFLESEGQQKAQYFKFWVVPCSSWVIDQFNESQTILWLFNEQTRIEWRTRLDSPRLTCVISSNYCFISMSVWGHESM